MVDSQEKKLKLIELQLTKCTEESQGLRVVCESLFSAFRSLPKPTPGCCQALAIAGPNPGVGASTIALLSALALRTEPANSVLLVDGNLRKPELHKHFGTQQGKGLVEFVEHELDLLDVLHKEKRFGFHFLPAGQLLNSPSTFFGSEKFSNTLMQLKKDYRFIIFDCASVLSAPETSILASLLTGLIMVVQSESSRREVASAAKQQLVDANTNITGVILNKQKHYIPEFLYKRL